MWRCTHGFPVGTEKFWRSVNLSGDTTRWRLLSEKETSWETMEHFTNSTQEPNLGTKLRCYWAGQYICSGRYR